MLINELARVIAHRATCLDYVGTDIKDKHMTENFQPHISDHHVQLIDVSTKYNIFAQYIFETKLRNETCNR